LAKIQLATIIFRARGYSQNNNRVLLKMENSDGSQHQNPSGECSLTPLLFDDTPRDAEPVPKVLVDMFENGAKFSRVPEFTWSVQKDAKSAKLRKELSVSFSVDTVVSSQEILIGFDAAGIDID